MQGVNQVQQNAKQGLTFAAALRSFLRQDPDIVMVGEIRDLETAEIAIKAAQTGHLVLSTLHTNDAPATVARLVNMGVAPFNIVSTLHLVLAQRLARTLHSCRKLEKVEEEKLLAIGFEEEEIAEGIRIYGPGECDQCTGGYKGRTGVFQVMPISEEMEKIILNNGGAIEIAHQADTGGFISQPRFAISKFKQGMIIMDDMKPITKD